MLNSVLTRVSWMVCDWSSRRIHPMHPSHSAEWRTRNEGCLPRNLPIEMAFSDVWWRDSRGMQPSVWETPYIFSKCSILGELVPLRNSNPAAAAVFPSAGRRCSASVRTRPKFSSLCVCTDLQHKAHSRSHTPCPCVLSGLIPLCYPQGWK